MSDQFPPEILYDILSRLPIKSLARFQCVCKLWFKYINDPYLETIHVKEEPTPIMFERSYVEELLKISFLRVTQGTCSNEPIMNMRYKSSIFAKTVQGSCNGLTLVRYHQDSFLGDLFAVTNPLSKQYYELPIVKTGWSFGSLAAGIGFDESTNTFKTVCVMYKRQHDINMRPKELRTMVYSLGMRSWREIAHNPAYLISGEGVFAHGRLHWLDSIDRYWAADYVERKIVWFDVKMEEFGLTGLPKQNFSSFKTRDRVVDLMGELGYAFFNRGFVELWILKKEEWVLHCCIHLHHGMHNVVISGCLNKYGDILLTAVEDEDEDEYGDGDWDEYGDGMGHRLFVYTLKNGDLQQVNLDEQYESDIRMYQSSLSSICAASISAYSVRNRSTRKIIDSIAFSRYFILFNEFIFLLLF